MFVLIRLIVIVVRGHAGQRVLQDGSFRIDVPDFNFRNAVR
jgi:hypothetical protein